MPPPAGLSQGPGAPEVGLPSCSGGRASRCLLPLTPGCGAGACWAGEPPSRGGLWLPSGFHCGPDGPRGCRGSCDSRSGVGPRVLCGVFLCHCRRHGKFRGCARHACIRPRSCGPGVPHQGHWAKSRPRPAAFLLEPLGDRLTPDLPPPRAGLRALACGPCAILRACSVACEALLPQSRPPPTAAGKGACDCVHWNIPG